MKSLSSLCGLLAVAFLSMPLLANDYFVMAVDGPQIIAKQTDNSFGAQILAYTESELLPSAKSTFGGVQYDNLKDDVTTTLPDLRKFIDSGANTARTVGEQARTKVAEMRPAELNSEFTALLPGRATRMARRSDRVEDRATRGQDVSARLSGSRSIGLSSCGAGGCSNGSCAGGSCGSSGACNSGACGSTAFAGSRTVQLPGNSCGGGSCGSGSCGSGSCGGGRGIFRRR